MLRETVRRLARRFVAGSTPEQARRAALDARRAGQAFTLDVLGEACLSDVEAMPTRRATSSWSRRSGARPRTGRRRRGSTRHRGVRCHA